MRLDSPGSDPRKGAIKWLPLPASRRRNKQYAAPYGNRFGRFFNFQTTARRRVDTDLRQPPSRSTTLIRTGILPAGLGDSPWRSNRFRCLRGNHHGGHRLSAWMAKAVRRPSRRTQPISIRLFRRRLPACTKGLPECSGSSAEGCHLVLTRKGGRFRRSASLDYLVTGN